MWTHTKESQEKITPHQALLYLKEGNHRFVNNLKMSRDLLQQVNQTSEGQFPFATILSCIDSRTSAELVFDQGLGDIFSIRIAGNVVNEDILGSMEYACDVAGSKVIVVLGHTRCSAVMSACKQLNRGHMTGLMSKLHPAIEAVRDLEWDKASDDLLKYRNVAMMNVWLMIKKIRSESKILKELEESGSIVITGGLYLVETGEVLFFENTRDLIIG